MKVLRAGRQLAVGEVTLVPVERRSIQSDSGQAGYWLHGLKEPFAVVVCDTVGIRAFDIAGADLVVEALTKRVVDLDRVLAGLRR